MINNLLVLISPLLIASSQIIVGKQWPPPRWFIANSAPVGDSFVVADTIQVTADGDDVVAPS